MEELRGRLFERLVSTNLCLVGVRFSKKNNVRQQLYALPFPIQHFSIFLTFNFNPKNGSHCTITTPVILQENTSDIGLITIANLSSFAF